MARKDDAYQYLKEAILSLELPPDSPISELAVAETLQMSRTPIREALRELESEGLVVSYPARGAFVASLTPYDVEDVYEMRMLCEEWAITRSIHRITPPELDQLEADFQKAYDTSDWALFHKTDRLLHGLIVERSGSRRLTDFVRTLNAQAERIRRISARGEMRSQRSYEEHMAILRSIRKGDAQEARAVLSTHLRSVADSAIEASKFRL